MYWNKVSNLGWTSDRFLHCILSWNWYHSYSLAYATLYLTVATLIRRFDMEISDSTEDELRTARDFLIPFPEKGQAIVKARVKNVLTTWMGTAKVEIQPDIVDFPSNSLSSIPLFFFFSLYPFIITYFWPSDSSFSLSTLHLSSQKSHSTLHSSWHRHIIYRSKKVTGKTLILGQDWTHRSPMHTITKLSGFTPPNQSHVVRNTGSYLVVLRCKVKTQLRRFHVCPVD